MTAPYPFDERREVLPFVPPSARTVLDVGCGPGGFGLALRDDAAAGRTLWAIEADPVLAAAAEPHYDRLLLGSFPEALDQAGDVVGYFDCVVFNDVLEHMVDPWEALRLTLPLLAPGGTVVASLPTIRNARTVADLVVRGRWTYVDLGVLDRTHLRFFTRRTIRSLFHDTGFCVEAMAGIHAIGASRGGVFRALPVLLGEFAYTGFALRARPIGTP